MRAVSPVAACSSMGSVVATSASQNANALACLEVAPAHDACPGGIGGPVCSDLRQSLQILADAPCVRPHVAPAHSRYRTDVDDAAAADGSKPHDDVVLEPEEGGGVRRLDPPCIRVGCDDFPAGVPRRLQSALEYLRRRHL